MTVVAPCSCGCAALLVVSEGQAQCRCECACCGSRSLSREREVAELEALRAGVGEGGGALPPGGAAPRRRLRRARQRLGVCQRMAAMGVLLLAIPVLTLVYVGFHAPPSDVPGRPAPVFALPLLDDGDQYGTRQLKGRLVVLTFWASWCEPCALDARILDDAWRRYRHRGLVVVGVNLDRSEADAVAFVRRHGVTYPNVRDSGAVAGAFGVGGVPETYFLDGNWTVSSVYRGFGPGVDEGHGLVSQEPIHPPILQRRIAALFASRSAGSPPPGDPSG